MNFHLLLPSALLGKILSKAFGQKDEALRSAARLGMVEFVDALVMEGADVHSVDMDGSTLLMMAASRGRSKFVKDLFSRGADANQARSSDNADALMLAAQEGHLATVRALLAAGVDVHRATKNRGFTALMYAAKQGHVDVVVALLEYGADVHRKGHWGTPLMIAARNRHANVVQVLLSGNSFEAEDLRAAYQQAIWGKDLSVCRLLLRAGVVPCVDLLAMALLQDYDDEVMDLVTTKQVLPDHHALSIACNKGRMDIVNAMLSAGVQDLHRNPRGRDAALIVASRLGDLECVNALLRAGSDPNMLAAKENATAVSVASSKGHLEVVKALLAAGADPDVSFAACDYEPWITNHDELHESPLHGAAFNGHLEVVEELVRAGATVNVGWRSPLDVAMAMGHSAVAKALVAAGSIKMNKLEDILVA
jgi:ankyrin repeat protein